MQLCRATEIDVALSCEPKTGRGLRNRRGRRVSSRQDYEASNSRSVVCLRSLSARGGGDPDPHHAARRGRAGRRPAVRHPGRGDVRHGRRAAASARHGQRRRHHDAQHPRCRRTGRRARLRRSGRDGSGAPAPSARAGGAAEHDQFPGSRLQRDHTRAAGDRGHDRGRRDGDVTVDGRGVGGGGPRRAGPQHHPAARRRHGRGTPNRRPHRVARHAQRQGGGTAGDGHDGRHRHGDDRLAQLGHYRLVAGDGVVCDRPEEQQQPVRRVSRQHARASSTIRGSSIWARSCGARAARASTSGS